MLKYFDFADLIGSIGLFLVAVGGYLIAGWPFFLVVLGVIFVFVSIVLGSNSAKREVKNGDTDG